MSEERETLQITDTDLQRALAYYRSTPTRVWGDRMVAALTELAKRRSTSASERGMREKAALFDYLVEYCSYNYGGDSYSEPSPPEFGIQWQWQATTTERPGMLEQLRRDAFAKFDLYVNEMDPDDTPTEWDQQIMEHRAALSPKGEG